MHKLTREVRFVIAPNGDIPVGPPPRTANGHAGYPPLTGVGHFFILRITVAGELQPNSNYLLNIKEVDCVVRERGIAIVASAIRDGTFGGGAGVTQRLFGTLRDAWPAIALDGLSLCLSPYLTLSVNAQEYPMVRLSQKFEFSASHRLFNPDMDDAANLKLFGKCSNPHGHGHNYELQVTLRGEPAANGLLIDVPLFERIVFEMVIERFDHKNLNVEVPEFAKLNPTVENIAAAIYKLLKPRFTGKSATLASVTVWETPKTWCEYGE